MGFHVCEFCERGKTDTNRFNHLSSGDVNLTFTNGHRWVMPDMILHYVADHGWVPPDAFIDDVMDGELAAGDRRQTRGIGDIFDATHIGYLSGPFERGSVPEGFVERLESLMHEAGLSGNRAQTKGLPVMRGR